MKPKRKIYLHSKNLPLFLHSLEKLKENPKEIIILWKLVQKKFLFHKKNKFSLLPIIKIILSNFNNPLSCQKKLFKVATSENLK
jgi:2-C-methyl-D-erythritol 4-phosphate cytidylyltransferase